jgi:hypothetical protein
MEASITDLLSAISSGSIDLINETTKDAYKALRQAIQKKLGVTESIDEFVENPQFEKHRDRFAKVLEDENGTKDAELIVLAKRLLDAINEKGAGPASSTKYHLQVPRGQVGVIGEHVHIEGGIHFHNNSGHFEPTRSEVGIPSIPKGELPPEPQDHRFATDFQPGGALETNSPLYIQRQADSEVMAGVGRHRGMVTLQGPSQTGKTSMLLRLYSQIGSSQTGLKPVIVDFQSLPKACFESLPAIWRSIAAEVDAQLGIGALDDTSWRSTIGYDRNLTDYLERSVFTDADTLVLICLDEVNKVFGLPIRSEFFSSVRYFFNRGAHDPVWKKLRWLLSTSSEPRFFIDDLNQSPFNVGAKVPLGVFTFEETAEFVRRYGFSPDTERVGRIMACLGGRPFLVHLLLHHMAQQPEREAQLLDPVSAAGSIFKAHLDHYLARFQEQPDLTAAMKRVIAGHGCPNVRLADRLCAAGLAKEDDGAKIVCTCELYATYFGRRL